VYQGPIGAVLTPQLVGPERAADLPYASSLCGACRDACPVKIDIPRLLLHLRAHVTERVRAPASPIASFAVRIGAAVMSSPALFRIAGRAAYGLQRLLGNRLIASLPGPAGAWGRSRSIPTVARVPLRDRLRDR
jgi:L-lactate dehydrogenase complex protein LldF